MSELHLSPDELLVWRDEGAGDRDRIVAHLAHCAECRHVAADLERIRPAESQPLRFDAKHFVTRGYALGRAPGPTRMWKPAAAVVILAVIVLPRWFDSAEQTATVLRGVDSRIVIVSPTDTTIATSELRLEWKVEGGLDRAQLSVFDLSNPGEPLIRRAVIGTTYDPTADEQRMLPTGRDLYWFVEYRDSRGAVVTSPAARFAVK